MESKVSNAVDKYMFKDNSNTRYTTVEIVILQQYVRQLLWCHNCIIVNFEHIQYINPMQNTEYRRL